MDPDWLFTKSSLRPSGNFSFLGCWFLHDMQMLITNWTFLLSFMLISVNLWLWFVCLVNKCQCVHPIDCCFLLNCAKSSCFSVILHPCTCALNDYFHMSIINLSKFCVFKVEYSYFHLPLIYYTYGWDQKHCVVVYNWNIMVCGYAYHIWCNITDFMKPPPKR